MEITKNMSNIKIKRALVSLSDKSNLKNLLRTLKKFKIEIISSGGTFKYIVFKCFRARGAHAHSYMFKDLGFMI